jgi:hypothetical protein
MSVLSCNRLRCDNIMCDTYIDRIGYICDECKEEFKQYLETYNIVVTDEGSICRELLQFMNTSKIKENYTEFDNGEIMDVDTFFVKYSR